MKLLRLQVHLITIVDAWTTVDAWLRRSVPTHYKHDERGQATAEYALVLLGAAAIAVFVVAWVLKTDLLGNLLDRVFGKLLTKADAG